MVHEETGGNKEAASLNTRGSGCNSSLTYFFFLGIMAEEILRRDLKGENEVKCVDVCSELILNLVTAKNKAHRCWFEHMVSQWWSWYHKWTGVDLWIDVPEGLWIRNQDASSYYYSKREWWFLLKCSRENDFLFTSHLSKVRAIQALWGPCLAVDREVALFHDHGYPYEKWKKCDLQFTTVF